jgi:acetoin:2,6-dichlorophenolindophenol oxidoreductase subunit beta
MSTKMTFREALNLAMVHEMESDPSVFVFGLDVSDHKGIFGSTDGLVKKFGLKRCFSTPLCEDGLTGVALGSALSGLRPILVHIRADFMLLSMNQIANMVSCLRYLSGGKCNIPLVIRSVIGRGWGQGAQHSKSLHGSFAHIPGLKVALPSRPQDAYTMLRAAVRDPNPVIFIEHRWLYDVPGSVDLNEPISLGKPAVLREGKAISVICSSWMNVEALKAADVLAKRGVELEVVDVRVIAPLEPQLLVDSVKRTGLCIVADYDWVYCGFSAEIAAIISHECFGNLKKPVERIGFAHAPCPTTRPLENLFYPTAIDIIRKAENMLGLEPMDLSGEEFFSYERKFKGPF